MTLSAYLRVLRERWRLILLFVLAATGLAVVITAMTPKQYEATVQLFVVSTQNTDPAAQYQGSYFTVNQVQTFASIVASPDVLRRVRADTNLPLTDAELKSKISATAPTGKSIIDLQVRDSSASRAADIANSASRAFITVVEGYYNGSGGGQNGSAKPLSVFITDPATAPSTAVVPRPALNIAIGLLFGLLAGVATAIGRDILDNRVKSPDTLVKAAKAPLMGTVVDDPSATKYPLAIRAPRSIRAENFRQLRANLQFANVDQHPRVIAITSSIPGEGKTAVAMNLASALSEAGFTVCLVDADLRRATVAKALGLVQEVGLTSVLIHQIGLSEALQSAGRNLYVLGSGTIPPNPSEVLASTYARDVIRSLLDKVDYVVIDTAPLLPVSDGSEVAALADGTLLVAQHSVTTDAQVKRSVGVLGGVDAKLIGVVLNRVPQRRTGGYSYEYSYYGEKPSRDAKSGIRARMRPRPEPDRSAV